MAQSFEGKTFRLLLEPARDYGICGRSTLPALFLNESPLSYYLYVLLLLILHCNSKSHQYCSTSICLHTYQSVNDGKSRDVDVCTMWFIVA